VANPVYESHNPVRKMVYVMLFEREFYVHTHAVRGFSLLQRFELWQATVNVIRYNRWIGVGTGDVDDALHAELRNMNSELADTSKRSHNQYLSLMAAFGVVGAVLLLVMFLRPLVRRATKPSPLMVAWMLTVLISFLTEDTLDTLAGILFCTFFLAFSKQQCTNTTL
jgi:O-antigen ligase